MGFEVLTAMNLKITVFWNVTSCSLKEGANVSEKYGTSIFRVEYGGSRFL
jgi:hypothetical protein